MKQIRPWMTEQKISRTRSSAMTGDTSVWKCTTVFGWLSNDGSCIVDPDELKIVDYNTTPTAKRYFQKLNEEYQKGIVDPESFTQTYDEYIANYQPVVYLE